MGKKRTQYPCDFTPSQDIENTSIARTILRFCLTLATSSGVWESSFITIAFAEIYTMLKVKLAHRVEEDCLLL